MDQLLLHSQLIFKKQANIHVISLDFFILVIDAAFI